MKKNEVAARIKEWASTKDLRTNETDATLTVYRDKQRKAALVWVWDKKVQLSYEDLSAMPPFAGRDDLKSWLKQEIQAIAPTRLPKGAHPMENPIIDDVSALGDEETINRLIKYLERVVWKIRSASNT